MSAAPIRTRKLGRTGVSVTRTRPRHGAARRPLRQGRGRRGGGDHRSGVGRRRALFRHLALVRARAVRASPRPGALPQEPRRLRHLDQDRAVAAPAAQTRPHQGPVDRRPQLRDGVRLRLRRGHAFVRGQPAATGNQFDRPSARPRPGQLESQEPRQARRLLCSARSPAAGARSRNCATPARSRESAQG